VTVLGEREREAVREALATLERDVDLRLDLGPAEAPVALLTAGGREIDPCAETRAVVEDVASLSGRVSLEVVEHDRPGCYPALTIRPGLTYLGMPWGYELATLVHGIAAAGASASGLSPVSLQRLSALECDVALDVFVTPT
jgi:alkyl hydroperoxide reductase subunit AhpF